MPPNLITAITTPRNIYKSGKLDRETKFIKVIDTGQDEYAAEPDAPNDKAFLIFFLSQRHYNDSLNKKPVVISSNQANRGYQTNATSFQ